jgi:N utilization substance protein A
MPSSELQLAFNEIASVRALPPEMIIDALQTALVSAYRKFSGASSAQAIEAHIEPSTGRVSIFAEKEVVDEVVSPATEVTLEKARYYHPECDYGDMVMVKEEGTAKSFGRIAAQTAKQVILQKIREAERMTLYNEFVGRAGEIVSATVQSTSQSMVTLSLNSRAEAILPRNQQIPGERYTPHTKLRVLILEVKHSNKGPQIICSRSHRDMLRCLLEYEVPEIYNGQVEIKSIAREAGQRSKVAVRALQEGIDPVGACVGMKGIRIQGIVKELNNERIDVIEWTPSAEHFILNALSPARVAGVFLEEDATSGRTAVVVVPDYNLSQAIGKDGQNARLAAKLTGWRIDIKSASETADGALENLDVPPLSSLLRTHPALVEDARKIAEKRRAGRVLTQEEYDQEAAFAAAVERVLYVERESDRRKQQAQIEAVRSTIPEVLFKMPIVALGLNDNITSALEPLESVGQVMLSLLIDESSLSRLLRSHEIPVLQEALDNVMAVDLESVETELAAEIEPKAAAPAPVKEAAPAPVPSAPTKPKQEAVAPVDDATPISDAVFVDPTPPAPAPEVEVDEYTYDFTPVDDEDDELGDKVREKKKDKKKNRRQLVYDEDSGEVRANRARKPQQRGKRWGGDFEEDF